MLVFMSFIFINATFSFALSEAEKTLNNFWSEIGASNNWYQFMAKSVQNEYRDFVNDASNKRDMIGLLAVKKAELIRVYKISEKEAPHYPELEPYKNKLYYKVIVKMETYRDNEYFKNGVNEYCMIVVEENQSYKIGSLSLYNHKWQDKAGWGFADPGEEPSTINVMDQNFTVHYNVPMKDFVFNVVCNEIGNLGYERDAVKANILAVKMAGWWFKRIGYYAGQGYDTKYGMVTFMNYNRASQENQEYISDCINSVINYSLFANNGQVFFTSYFDGSENNSGQNTGQLRQNGSNYLAKIGYGWKEILHYYYDNSSYNNNNTGIVIIA